MNVYSLSIEKLTILLGQIRHSVIERYKNMIKSAPDNIIELEWQYSQPIQYNDVTMMFTPEKTYLTECFPGCDAVVLHGTLDANAILKKVLKNQNQTDEYPKKDVQIMLNPVNDSNLLLFANVLKMHELGVLYKTEKKKAVTGISFENEDVVICGMSHLLSDKQGWRDLYTLPFKCITYELTTESDVSKQFIINNQDGSVLGQIQKTFRILCIASLNDVRKYKPKFKITKTMTVIPNFTGVVKIKNNGTVDASEMELTGEGNISFSNKKISKL